jgi:hypothetical protein
MRHVELSKLVDELVSLPSYYRIEDRSHMIINEITKFIALRHEHKSGGFQFLSHAARIDAMQGFGIAKPGTRCGRVIDDDQHDLDVGGP